MICHGKKVPINWQQLFFLLHLHQYLIQTEIQLTFRIPQPQNLNFSFPSTRENGKFCSYAYNIWRKQLLRRCNLSCSQGYKNWKQLAVPAFITTKSQHEFFLYVTQQPFSLGCLLFNNLRSNIPAKIKLNTCFIILDWVDNMSHFPNNPGPHCQPGHTL